jgi:hypothetical protein
MVQRIDKQVQIEKLDRFKKEDMAFQKNAWASIYVYSGEYGVNIRPINSFEPVALTGIKSISKTKEMVNIQFKNLKQVYDIYSEDTYYKKLNKIFRLTLEIFLDFILLNSSIAHTDMNKQEFMQDLFSGFIKECLINIDTNTQKISSIIGESIYGEEDKSFISSLYGVMADNLAVLDMFGWNLELLIKNIKAGEVNKYMDYMGMEVLALLKLFDLFIEKGTLDLEKDIFGISDNAKYIKIVLAR